MVGSLFMLYQNRRKAFKVLITNLGILPLMLDRVGTVTPYGSFPLLVGFVSLLMR
jgi:hypothetical protein